MKYKSYYLSVFLVLLYCITFAQTKTGNSKIARETEALCDTVFPKCFIGNWKGKLQWMVAGKPTQIFTMQLRIQPTDSTNQYTWQIIYADDNKDNRPYILKPIDTAKGYWVVDENDGIILDSYVLGNCIHGAFTVQGNTIVDNYCVEGNTMKVEFLSIKLCDKKQSGKGTEETPVVDSYKISSYQTGGLSKIQ